MTGPSSRASAVGPAAPPPQYAETKEEAEGRATKWATQDPYPNIPPALLNAADIQDYVASTGMIAPFHGEADKHKLKAASYEVDLLGKYSTGTRPATSTPALSARVSRSSSSPTALRS